MALRVIQVIHHPRIGGKAYQQVPEITQAVLPEHGDHPAHLFAAVNLAVAGAEDHVPEQGHLFLELAGAVDHAVHPHLGVNFDGSRMIVGGMVTKHKIFVDGRLTRGIEQLGHCSLITLSRFSFNLGTTSTKTGPPQQVSHQGDILFRHVGLLIFNFWNPWGTL